MMFLEFFIWGAWFVTMGTYLNAIKFDGTEIANAYTTTAWGAIISPVLVGMIADRFFNAEKVMGIMHLLGAVLIYYASTIKDPLLFFIVLLAYAVCYMPTIALANAICFNQMSDTTREFPPIRVLGTIGWIVAGVIVGVLKLEPTAYPLQIAAAVSIVLGIFSFMLPKTPPQAAGEKVTLSKVLGFDALKLMKDRSFAVFAIGSLLICIPLSFYYGFANLFFNESGMKNAAAKMTMGQGSEVFFLLLMPVFFRLLGIKKMLLTGMLFWAGRYLLFAFGNNGPLVFMFYLGILFHGVCYDFFFVTGQIYVDKRAPEAIRSSAQGFIAWITYGVGMVIGTWAAGFVVQYYQVMSGTEITGHLWRNIWLTPAIMAIVVIILFALLFKEPKNGEKEPVDATMRGITEASESEAPV